MEGIAPYLYYVFFRNRKMKIFYKTQFIIRGKMGVTRRKSI